MLQSYQTHNAYFPNQTPKKAVLGKELDDEEEASLNESALPVSLKEYYQSFDNVVNKGMSSFEESSVLKKTSPSNRGGLRKPIGNPLSSPILPIRTFQTSKSSSVLLSSPNASPSKGTRTVTENAMGQQIDSSFYQHNDHNNPFNGSMMRSGISLPNDLKVQTAESKYRSAYGVLKENDVANVTKMDFSLLQKDAEEAQKRWKSFIHNTNNRNYTQQSNGDDLNDDFHAIYKTKESDLPIEDNLEEYLNTTVKGAVAELNNNSDFNILYSRSIVVQQSWPWTCLVDMKTNKCFYRNEVQDFFQFDPPDVFQSALSDPLGDVAEDQLPSDTQPALFNLLEGEVEGNDGTVSLF